MTINSHLKLTNARMLATKLANASFVLTIDAFWVLFASLAVPHPSRSPLISFNPVLQIKSMLAFSDFSVLKVDPVYWIPASCWDDHHGKISNGQECFLLMNNC